MTSGAPLANPIPNEARSALTELLAAAQRVWDTYQASGPGQLDAELHEPVRTAAQTALASLHDTPAATDWSERVRRIDDLSHRCACRSEGLCFVTGEAGLIPRQDLITRFTDDLQQLTRALQSTSADG